MMLCQLLGGSSKQNLVSLFVIILTNGILKLNDDAVDCGINLYSVGEIFLKGGKETNQIVHSSHHAQECMRPGAPDARGLDLLFNVARYAVKNV
jgi:hypothetical protein